MRREGEEEEGEGGRGKEEEGERGKGEEEEGGGRREGGGGRALRRREGDGGGILVLRHVCVIPEEVGEQGLPSESIVHRWESHCTMGQVGLSMGIHCPTWVHSIPLPPYHVGQVGMTMGIPCTTHILLYHVGQVGRPMEYHPYPQCCPRSYCPSYPTVPCRTGGTSNGIPPIPPVLPQILLSVLSYCTM